VSTVLFYLAAALIAFGGSHGVYGLTMLAARLARLTIRRFRLIERLAPFLPGSILS